MASKDVETKQEGHAVGNRGANSGDSMQRRICAAGAVKKRGNDYIAVIFWNQFEEEGLMQG